MYGGVALGPQIGEMRRGVDVIVGTPGRIIDHIEQRNLNLVRMKTRKGGKTSINPLETRTHTKIKTYLNTLNALDPACVLVLACVELQY